MTLDNIYLRTTLHITIDIYLDTTLHTTLHITQDIYLHKTLHITQDIALRCSVLSIIICSNSILTTRENSSTKHFLKNLSIF